MESLGYYSDQSRSDVRIDSALAAAEFEQRSVNSHHAATMVAIHSVLDEARLSPDVFVGPHASPANPEHVEFAERAAIADLAVRLAMSETTVRMNDHQATTMMARTPKTWQAFRWGEISPANARTIGEFAAFLPDGATALFAEFDDAVIERASQLAPARFRTYARRVRERLVADSAAERHKSERANRRVVWEPALDGMAWVAAYLPAEVATAAMARLDADAAALVAHIAATAAAATATAECADATATGDNRTLAQLRADLFAGWLTGSLDNDQFGTQGGIRGGASVGVRVGAPVGVRVGVLIPMLTLLGHSELPATLEGYGPIDADTARRLAGGATSLYRILTDPVTGAVLDIDTRKKYIPEGLRRMRQLIDENCTFPGCGKRAANCDLDHTIDRQFGGHTTLRNLTHLCRKHHRDKHETRWSITQSDAGVIEWTSPTGHVAKPDPPPF